MLHNLPLVSIEACMISLEGCGVQTKSSIAIRILQQVGSQQAAIQIPLNWQSNQKNSQDFSCFIKTTLALASKRKNVTSKTIYANTEHLKIELSISSSPSLFGSILLFENRKVKQKIRFALVKNMTPHLFQVQHLPSDHVAMTRPQLKRCTELPSAEKASDCGTGSFHTWHSAHSLRCP